MGTPRACRRRLPSQQRMPLPFFEEPTGPALWISLLPNERWGLVVHVEFLATLNAESEDVSAFGLQD